MAGQRAPVVLDFTEVEPDRGASDSESFASICMAVEPVLAVDPEHAPPPAAGDWTVM